MQWVKCIVDPFVLFASLAVIGQCKSKSQKCPGFFIHRGKGEWNTDRICFMKDIEKTSS